MASPPTGPAGCASDWPIRPSANRVDRRLECKSRCPYDRARIPPLPFPCRRGRAVRGRAWFLLWRAAVMMTREQATEAIVAAKQKKGLTFEAIAKAVGRHKVWVTAALFG